MKQSDSRFKSSLRVLALVALLASAQVRAEVIELSSRELDAAYTLVRPETTRVILDGQGGVFEPAAALRYFGIETQQFPVDMTLIGDIVDLQFDQLTARMPYLRFHENRLEVAVPFDDRPRGLRSRVGSMSFRNVVVSAFFHWKEMADGRRELSLQSTRIRGELKGTGLLNLLEGRVRTLALRLMTERMNRILHKPEIQENLLEGLSHWARFTLGNREVGADPTTFQFFGGAARDGSSGGVRFETVR